MTPLQALDRAEQSGDDLALDLARTVAGVDLVYREARSTKRAWAYSRDAGKGPEPTILDDDPADRQYMHTHGA